MAQLVVIFWAVIASVLLLRFWFLDSKKTLLQELRKVQAIQNQLFDVVEMENVDSKWRDEAYFFCKGIEKCMIRHYNSMMKQPSYFITAKLLGYPTKLFTGGQQRINVA